MNIDFAMTDTSEPNTEVAIILCQDSSLYVSTVFVVKPLYTS